MAVQDYKINYKSDFVLTINGDAGWAVPFCIKFWTGMPSQAYFVGFDGVKYVNCRVGDTPTQLLVMFDDHHLPIGKLKMQIAYHTTIEEFPGSVFDEVTNARDVIVTIDGTDYHVMLDFTGEDAPELEFDLPAYANEAERIQNELQRQQNEADRIAAELQREQATTAAVQGAENVNAQLAGNILTVTNRQGVSTSVNTKGEQGAQGPVGPEGQQGEQGPKGEKGDTGATGPQGIQGPAGPQGQTGVSITDFVKTGETETDTLYDIEFSDDTTKPVAIPKGEKGDQGEQGPEGPQGPMGDVAVITPEQQAAFTMYSETGQNTDGPMTQKAVTDNIIYYNVSSITSKFDWINKKFIVGKDNGTVPLGSVYNSSSKYSYASDYVDVSSFEIIEITLPQLNQSDALVGACFYDSEKNPISGIGKGELSPTGMIAYTFEVPYNAKYIRTTKRTDPGFAQFYCNGIVKTTVKEKIDINNGIPFSLSFGLISATPAIDGQYYYIESNTITNYIDISNIDYIYYPRIKTPTGDTLYSASFFDDNKTFICGERAAVGSNGYIPSVIAKPEGAMYLRVTFFRSDNYGRRFILNVTDSEVNSRLIQKTLDNLTFTDNKIILYANGDVYNSSSGKSKCTEGYIDISEYRGGKLFYPRIYFNDSGTVSAGIAFYDKSLTYISGVVSRNGDFGADFYVKTTVDIPSEAWYIRVTALQDNQQVTYDDYYLELCTFSSKVIENVQGTEEDASITSISYYDERISPVDSHMRFYKAMEEKLDNYGVEGYIIEGPSGAGRYDYDEFENPVMGHGHSSIPVYGLAKITSIALNYPSLADIWASTSHIIRTKGVESETVVTKTLNGTYGHYLTDYYTILTWKTGTYEGIRVRNLICTATNDTLKGQILSAVISYHGVSEDDTHNRYKAMKLLLDIGTAKFFDRGADTTNLEGLLIEQDVAHAQVIVCPDYPRFMKGWDLNNSSYYQLYDYHGKTEAMNTMSTVKMLTALVVLDYVNDLDEYIEIHPNDLYMVQYVTSSEFFEVGEKVTIRDLLYALLFPSSNQAGYALARVVGNYLLRTYRGDGFLPQ